MQREDHKLLEPNMRVRIMPRLMGQELYGAEDPESLQKWCGQDVTVSHTRKHSTGWMVYIQEDENACFYMEEIECIIEDSEIPESDEPLNVLFGV